MQTNKKWYLSKTLWLAVLTGVVGILTALSAEFPNEGIFITVIGILNFFLRLNTDSGIK